MAWPKNTDYHEAIQNPRVSFHDEELRGGEVAGNALGLPMLWSGGFADVYKVHCPATGNTWAVKCFTREVRSLQERYRSIAEHLKQARLPFTVDFQYLDQGIRIAGVWFPILKMHWVEGLTLDQFVKEHLDRPKNLEMLLDLWVKLAARLRDANMAHADLQHGNVLLIPMDRGALGLRLIDYDGMYVPSLAGMRSGELGHPAYQHPRRLREKIYNGEVDRFSHLVIYTSVRCLSVGGRESWQKFNNGDNLLFREVDFAAPGSSPAFRAFWQSGDQEVRTLVGRLALACGQRLEEVPWLDRVVDKGHAVPLSQTEEKEVNALLAASVQVPVAQAVPQTAAYVFGGSRPVGMPPLPVAPSVPIAALTGTAPATAAGTVPRMDGLGSPSYNATAVGTVPRMDGLGSPSYNPAAAGTVPGEAMKLPSPGGSSPDRPDLRTMVRGEAVELPSPGGRGAGGKGFLLWPLRKFDRLLSALVGPENAILHNFLRVVSVVALLAMVFLAVPFAFRSAPLPQASPAVYRVQIEPPGAKLAATGMGVSIEGDGAVRTVTIADPDGRREIVLMAVLDGYETLNRSLVPKAGGSDTLHLRLQPIPGGKPLGLPALVILPVLGFVLLD
ncbi:MAG: hypothetical protein WCJ35_15715 [Planctomycetota bacterium]